MDKEARLLIGWLHTQGGQGLRALLVLGIATMFEPCVVGAPTMEFATPNTWPWRAPASRTSAIALASAAAAVAMAICWSLRDILFRRHTYVMSPAYRDTPPWRDAPW